MSSGSDRVNGDGNSATLLLESAIDQVREESMLYNEAVGSYNMHLDNHRERRDLHDIPFREPVSVKNDLSDPINGDVAAIDALITHLIDQAHLDSQVRRHPRTYPIHVEAVEHLQLAREQLVSTLEEAFRHAEDDDG